MLKYSSGRARETGIASENYGCLRDSNNSLIRGRVYRTRALFLSFSLPFPTDTLPLLLFFFSHPIVLGFFPFEVNRVRGGGSLKTFRG